MSDQVNVPADAAASGGLQAIVEPLLAWYDRHRRILPWREQPTAYRVWVSEIMLQQTRVEAVKPYYEQFMRALPDVETLACADEETLLKLWEGLGYYNRVRNLQKAARQIMEVHGGRIPDTYEQLLSLSGIGSYTAGAVASIAYGKPYPAVDGNVLRVLARIRKDERLISEQKVKQAVERELQDVMPDGRPGDFNQAMMEIGACVCTPSGAPDCGSCPLADLCLAHRDGVETAYPKKASGKARAVEQKTVLVIRDEDRVALRRRPAQGLLAGMYEFPWLEGHCTQEEVADYLNRIGIKAIRILPLQDAKHIFTHKEWHMKGYGIQTDELEPRARSAETQDWIYIRSEETRHKYPIPTAFAAYTQLLKIKLGKENWKEEQE
ncbi:MAG: A/G-specific adenine glycosylase [Lachnospiraceae bacterium]|nr:A/G-specific adenine glycosylase [Lachnospiraceae bacterium]